MNPWNRDATAVQSQSTAVDQGLRSYMLRVYNYMASGVLLSAVVAYFAGTSPAVLQLLLTQNSSGGAGLSALGLAAVFSPLVMVFVFMARARTMSAGGLQAYFWTYAGLVGLSMFSIFLVYTQLSILRVFLTTAATFGLFSIYGYTTKRDLSSWGSFLIVGIWAIIGVSLVNMFLLHSSGVNLMLSYAGVLLAIGLIAYNTQTLKSTYYAVGGNELLAPRASILGALNLYVSFVILFQNLLYLTGNRR